jgi:hypothetical protein
MDMSEHEKATLRIILVVFCAGAAIGFIVGLMVQS